MVKGFLRTEGGRGVIRGNLEACRERARRALVVGQRTRRRPDRVVCLGAGGRDEKESHGLHREAEAGRTKGSVRGYRWLKVT